MLDIISLILVFTGVIILIFGNIFIRRNVNPIKKIKNNDCKFCVLIPARDESRVIGGLLNSIKNQNVKINMSDVYVIVESMEDKTVGICNDYGASVLLRTSNKQRKGFALDEGIKQIKKDYDLYFIFDADNIVDKNYFVEMLKTYKMGYDIGVGYRNCKNGNDNVIAACSSLTFSMINTLGNDFRKKYNVNIIVSGTGFYIRSEWIKKWNGYPFNSLTEDYELSLYAVMNNMTSYYNDNAVFYDEQPVKFSQTIKQRVRWIKGYFTSRKKYIPLIRKQLKNKGNNFGSKYSTCLGVTGYIFIVIGFILYSLNYITMFFISIFNHNISLFKSIGLLLLACLIIYLVMMFVTINMIKKDKLDLNKKMKFKAIFFNPLYLSSYLYCALKALFKKDVGWDRIDHTKN